MEPPDASWGVLGQVTRWLRMEPPYVESLGYNFLVLEPERLDFADAAPLRWTFGDFDCNLASGRLTAKPTVRFETEEEARDKLEPLLRGWECVAELRDGARVEFMHSGTSIYDPDPQRGTRGRVASVLRERYKILPAPPEPERPSQYPAPLDTAFDHRRHAAMMRDDIRDIRTGRERLLSGAYFLLTVLEDEINLPPRPRSKHKRDHAADTLNIEREVLNKLGKLTTKYRSREHRARKATAKKELTDQQAKWLHKVIGVLALRVGTYEAGGDISHRITMADPAPL